MADSQSYGYAPTSINNMGRYGGSTSSDTSPTVKDAPTNVTHRVHYDEKSSRETGRNRDGNYLTAKYKRDTMLLIRKRLEVENWIDEQLRKLYRCQNPEDDYDTEVDIDELLDIDETKDRIIFIKDKISKAPASKEETDLFLQKTLEKLETL